MSDRNTTTRVALAALLEHLQAHLDELEGDGCIPLSLTLLRHTNNEGVLDLDALSEAEIAELRTLVDRVAAQNGQRWDVTP